MAVLLGINNPGLDGLQLFWRDQTAGSDLPVMMIAVYGDDERRLQAAEFGAAEFLTKAVDFERLKAQLPQLLSAPD